MFLEAFLQFCEEVLYNEYETKIPSALIIAELLQSEFLSQSDQGRNSTKSEEKLLSKAENRRESGGCPYYSVKELYQHYDAVNFFFFPS